MTDYPSIKPEDVREGDVVRARFDAAQWPATIEGVVHYSLTNDEDYRLYVGGYVVSGATDLRLVSMGRCCTPPEPPLDLNDMGTDGQKWARAFVDRFGGDEGLMIGWFANAIETGRTAGMASRGPTSSLLAASPPWR